MFDDYNPDEPSIYTNEAGSTFTCGCGNTQPVGKLDPANQPFHKPVYILCLNCNAVYKANEHKYITIDVVKDRDEVKEVLGREFAPGHFAPHIPVPRRMPKPEETANDLR